MKFKALALCLVLASLIISPGCLDDESESQGEPIPAFSVIADDGATYSSENLLGQPYILHFSASWCNNCRSTMHAVSNHLSDSLYIIVSTDAADANKLDDWHAQVNGSQEDSTVDAPFSVNVELSRTLEINNTPTLILVNSKGEIVETQIGPLTDNVEIDAFWSLLG